MTILSDQVLITRTCKFYQKKIHFENKQSLLIDIYSKKIYKYLIRTQKDTQSQSSRKYKLK